MTSDASHPCALNEMSRAVALTLDPYAAMRQSMRSIARVTKCNVLGAYALEDNGEWLVPVQGYHLPPERLDALRAAKLSVRTNAFYAESSASGRPMFTANAVEQRGICETLRAMIPHHAQLFVPISGHG